MCRQQGLDHLNVNCRYYNMSFLYETPKNKDIFLYNPETMITFSHIIKSKKFKTKYYLT